MKSKKRLENMSDKKFNRLKHRLEKVEETEVDELSKEEEVVFGSLEKVQVDQAQVDKAVSKIERQPFIKKINALKEIQAEKLRVAGKITKTGEKKKKLAVQLHLILVRLFHLHS